MNGWSTSPTNRTYRDKSLIDRQQYRDWMREERPYEADDGEAHYNWRIPIRSDKAKMILAQIIQNDLTDQERQVLTMRYLQGMRPTDIAQALGTRISTVSSASSRARKKIYEFMKYALQ